METEGTTTNEGVSMSNLEKTEGVYCAACQKSWTWENLEEGGAEFAKELKLYGRAAWFAKASEVHMRHPTGDHELRLFP